MIGEARRAVPSGRGLRGNTEPPVVSLDALDQYENGRITPSLDAVARLAQALDVSLDSLVFDDQPRRPSTSTTTASPNASPRSTRRPRQPPLRPDAPLTRTRVRVLAGDAS